jgi:hypothetical protein
MSPKKASEKPDRAVKKRRETLLEILHELEDMIKELQDETDTAEQTEKRH